MKKSTKIALTAAGITALTAFGISRTITKTLIDEAFERTEPKLMSRSKRRISGNSTTDENMQIARQMSKKLSLTETERVQINSFDGATLIGHWYPAKEQKRIILAMHGWRSSWCNDFGTITDFWHDNGCSILYAEQRAQGESEGDHMGFGMIERYDCLEWVNWISQSKSGSYPVYLAGISMGATTVLMTAGFELPDCVHGIMADCGFTCAKAIWKHITEDNLHLSYRIRERRIDALCKKRIRIGSHEYSTLDAMAVNKKPILFVHGTADTFVPVAMTYENYNACQAPKRLLIVEGAKHGMSYLVDREKYEETVKEFWKEFD